MAQCAAGKNWKNKTMDLPLKSWTQYLQWANDPITAFIVPCIISDGQWHEVSREAGILIDRIRIMNLLPAVLPDASLIDDLRSWSAAQLAVHTV